MAFQKLDFTLTSAQQRIQHIEQILSRKPADQWSPAQLTYMADYILNNADDKSARKARSQGILTANRRATQDKREISFEGYIDLCSDQNKDQIYNHILNDKNTILSPRLQITAADIKQIPGMATLRDAIAATKEKMEDPTSPNRGKLLIQLIQLRKDQYVLKEAYRKPIRFQKITRTFHNLQLHENLQVTFNDDVLLVSGFSLCDQRCAATIAQNYAKLRDLTEYEIMTDAYYLLRQFEDLVQKYVRQQHPELFDILVLKTDNLLGRTIAEILNDKYGTTTFSDASISKLWRQKLPKVIAAGAQEEYLSYYYREKMRGRYRKCGKCNQIKLASPRYYQRNNHNSADGFYSICKECKNKKREPLKAREGWNGAHGL